jgi:hypothetical protein
MSDEWCQGIKVIDNILTQGSSYHSQLEPLRFFPILAPGNINTHLGSYLR